MHTGSLCNFYNNPTIDIDFLFKSYVDYNYNDSDKLVEIHEKCGGGLDSRWNPIEIVVDGVRTKLTGNIDMCVLDGLIYVLYGEPMDYTKECILECSYGSLTYLIKRNNKTKSIVEYIDGVEYPTSKGVDEQVLYMVGTLDDFRKKYIYDWNGTTINLEIEVGKYIDSASKLLSTIKDEKYGKVVEITKQIDNIDSDIKSIELDISSLQITKKDMFEIDRRYCEYNKLVERYNIELKKYRDTNRSISSIDSSVSEDGRGLLELKKKIYGDRYIPDEYHMMNSRYTLLDNLKTSIHNKLCEKAVLSTKLEYEREIVNGNLVPDDWLNIDIYKECISLDVESIANTYIEYIGINYKKELEYQDGNWSCEGISTEYCNWLISRCMMGCGFQIVIVDREIDIEKEGVILIRKVLSNNLST